MRTLVWLIFLVAIAAGSAVVFVPDARDRIEAATGVKLPAAPGATKSAGDAKSAGKRGPQAVPVTVATVVEQDMPVVLSAAGSVEALASVAIRSRVDGQIVSVGFNEGELVKEGQVLFQFDDRLVKAQIQQAEANIAKDVASLADAEATLARRETLIRQKITSEASLDTAKAAVGALKASINAGKAALDVQKTQLDYLTIRAPITARTGSLSAKMGSNVRAADVTPLVTLNQISPIVVSFAMPQSDLPALRDALKRGASADVNIIGTKPIRTVGKLTFVDNQVDKTTGTVTAKVTSENKDETLWPGQAVEVELTTEIKPKMLSVPASGILPSQQGMIAWIAGADNKVAAQDVVLERIVGQTAFIASGLKAGERVVIDGQLRIAPGTLVDAKEAAPPPRPKAAIDVPAASEPVPAPETPAKSKPAAEASPPGSKKRSPEAKSGAPVPGRT